MIQLRPYQRQAVDAVYDFLRRRDDNPCVVCPTGAGKAIILSQIASDAVLLWQGRVMVLTHVQELVEQNADKMRRLAPGLDVGIYSAGLGRRETEPAVICAGIQSVYKRAAAFAPFDLVIVDEAHLIAPEGEGMYRQFLADLKAANPQVRVIGLTATPFRLKSGLICTPENILNEVCFEIGVRELIRDGYLSPLVSKAGKTKVDTDALHVRGGEFVADEVEALMNQEGVVQSACREVVELTQDRKAVLLFASSVAHGRQVVRILQEEQAIECGFVCGDTPRAERDETLRRFQEGRLKYLANINVLTTGFDAPHVDCVAILRPTMSPGLLVQMIGRGFRLHPGKTDCLVLDFGGNILRHGPIDQIRVRPGGGHPEGGTAKECPVCQMLIASTYSLCPGCGYEFPTAPAPERTGHDPTASDVDVLSRGSVDNEFVVRDVRYAVHTKRNAPEDAPRTLRVDYQLSLHHWQSEFICFEHEGYARRKAIAWWKARSPDPVPDTAQQALHLAEAGSLAFAEKITIRHVAGEKYDQIVGYQLGPKPEPVEVTGSSESEWEEVPF